MVGFESYFYLIFIMNFFIEYTPDNATKPIRNHFLIAKKYLRDTFIIDLLCLIPFNLFIDLTDEVNHDKDQRFFLLIKILRLHQGFEIFKVSVIMASIKKLLTKRLMHIIETNPDKAND
jgi:hypothetical protein